MSIERDSNGGVTLSVWNEKTGNVEEVYFDDDYGISPEDDSFSQRLHMPTVEEKYRGFTDAGATSANALLQQSSPVKSVRCAGGNWKT